MPPSHADESRCVGFEVQVFLPESLSETIHNLTFTGRLIQPMHNVGVNWLVLWGHILEISTEVNQLRLGVRRVLKASVVLGEAFSFVVLHNGLGQGSAGLLQKLSFFSYKMSILTTGWA